MEKISRIIPANRRTSSAEISTSQPARPGAPAFGRPMGRVTGSNFDPIADAIYDPSGEKFNPRDKVSIGQNRVTEFSSYKPGRESQIAAVSSASNGSDPVADTSMEKPVESKEASQVQLVDNLQKKFFNTRTKMSDVDSAKDGVDPKLDSADKKDTEPLTLFDSSDLRKAALKENDNLKDKATPS